MSNCVINTHSYASPCGEITLASFQGKLCLCHWSELTRSRLEHALGAVCVEAPSSVLRKAVGELDEYFAGLRTNFSVPLLPIGTDFQRRVWQALTEIPYGATCSYGQIAQRIGKPSAVRAVAQAIGANPLCLFIPCHRVIGADGSLTGYAGGLKAKRTLLQIEGAL